MLPELISAAIFATSALVLRYFSFTSCNFASAALRSDASCSISCCRVSFSACRSARERGAGGSQERAA
jgi:hypothetical protein